VVPRAMIEAHVLSGGLGITFVAVFLLRLTDIQAALDDDSGYPFLFVFSQSFSPVIVKALATIVVGLLFAGTVSYNLSSSRQVWAVSLSLQRYVQTHEHPR
jgi:choline transport protein